MKEVIRIPETTQLNEKPIEITHYANPNNGWIEADGLPYDAVRVVYLGRCDVDGDVFAAYASGAISIYKGHLNSGKY